MRRSDYIAKSFFFVLGILLLGVGGNLIIDFARLNVRISNSRQVSATVVEVVQSSKRHRDMNHKNRRRTTIMYTPVYEYTEGGEVRRYISNVSTSKRAEIGSVTTLYISEDGKIYQKSGAAVTLFVGTILAVIGGSFTLFAAKLKRGISDE